MNRSGLPKRIRSAVAQHGGVDAFAALSKIGRSTVFALMAGGTPRVETIRKLRRMGVVVPRGFLDGSKPRSRRAA